MQAGGPTCRAAEWPACPPAGQLVDPVVRGLAGWMAHRLDGSLTRRAAEWLARPLASQVAEQLARGLASWMWLTDLPAG